MISPGWLLFEIGINAFESCLYLFFLKSRLLFSRKTYLADTLCILCYTLFLSMYLFFDLPFSDTFGAVIFIVYLHYACDDRWSNCILWVVFFEIMIIATAGIMLQIFMTSLSIPYDLLLSPSKYRVILVLSANFILFIEVFFFSMIGKQTSSLQLSSLIIFLVSNISVLIVIELIFSLQIQELYPSDLPFFASYALLLLCGVLSVILFHLMTSLNEREHQAQIALNHMQLTKEHQLTIQNMYDDMCKQRHDMRQHIQTLEQLIADQGSSTAKQYLDAYKTQYSAKAGFVTGSIAVDALLTTKNLACQRHGINFKLSQCPLNSLPISEIDFCTIVGNILDNAIEGNLRISDVHANKYIHLYFSHIYDMFIIRCENPVNLSTIRKDNKRFLTSKNDAQIHGFGIPNIISIADHADGSCIFEIKDNVFFATVTLPYPMKE